MHIFGNSLGKNSVSKIGLLADIAMM